MTEQWQSVPNLNKPNLAYANPREWWNLDIFLKNFAFKFKVNFLDFESAKN